MKKTKLAKLALTALTVASTLPAGACAEENLNSGTFLAANCGASKCGAGRKQSSCSASRQQASCSASRGQQASCGASRNNWTYNPSSSDPYSAGQNTYQAGDTMGNQSRSYGTSPSYTDSYRSTYAADSNTMAGSMTESDLNKQLNAQGKAIYQSLNAEGKAMALQLASQDTYRDKNLAVKEAQRRINERNGMNTSTSTYNSSYSPSSSYDSSSSSDYNRQSTGYSTPSSSWNTQSSDYNR